MNTLKLTLTAAALGFASMGAVAANVSQLDLSDRVQSLVQNLPEVDARGFEVDGPIFTREVIGFDGDDAIYGEIKGVVRTREVLGFDGDDTVYGDLDGVAFGVQLTPEQLAMLQAQDED